MVLPLLLVSLASADDATCVDCTVVPAALRRMAVDLPPAIGDALREQRWDDAYTGLKALDPGKGEPGAVERLRAFTRARSEAVEEPPGPPLVETWQQTAVRAERLVEEGRSEEALAALEGIVVPAAPSVDSCRARFVRGRALYKLNRLTDAVAALGGVGESCKDVTAEYGPRALYLIGTAEFRRKSYTSSAAAYQKLVALYPTHSMADDGLTRGGIAMLEAGRPDEARRLWLEALDTYPSGDTVPEATLRLAFDRYLAGAPSEARGLAARLGALPLEGDPVHVLAGRYWEARWELYPQVSDPDRATTDGAARGRGMSGLVRLCRDHPESYYAVLAYSRLRVLDRVAADGACTRDDVPSSNSAAAWQVRRTLLEDREFREGLDLLRLGLTTESRTAWSGIELDTFTTDEMGWITELRNLAGDWLLAHDDLRRWLVHRPLGTLGAYEPHIVRLAWPDRYWEEVKAAVKKEYSYDPRLFHALVREESSFDRTIVSFAGARGLSQLMPATARQTAGWLGMHLDDLATLDDPAVNLPIGARYLEAMHDQLAGSPFLALAAYNGGAANVGKWIDSFGNPPTDEFVERIPFEETRGYVKRVVGSWQTMRWWFDTEREAFPDLSGFVHRALPE
jgi:soluble lytic murein transglycosylase